MKQYLDQQQTAKLIELGFETPTMKNIPTPEGEINEEWYSIGELIEMLPKKIKMSDDETGELEVSFGDLCMVYYTSFGVIYYDTKATELIDALYDMIIMLKEKEMA